MAFALPDDPRIAQWKPEKRRAASSSFTYQTLEQLLDFPEGSRITSIYTDDTRDILSIRWEHDELPPVPEGQERPEIVPWQLHEYTREEEERRARYRH